MDSKKLPEILKLHAAWIKNDIHFQSVILGMSIMATLFQTVKFLFS